MTRATSVDQGKERFAGAEFRWEDQVNLGLDRTRRAVAGADGITEAVKASNAKL
ncbi:hypothetical protein [Phreatobacter oligotrophus]|uniref:hypothetical protein n=1 Tax=Phreatobacter oligotrophus TaxID=1122261 RepID=UPI0023577F00|nr:hypothetical protein [Phreatobacter oligotrophus]MBX9992454.1 hypothetical protein [Phreatobacter oligotrophus]